MSGILNILAAIKGAAATVTDAYFNLVTLLLNTSSTNGAQNNTFLDSSTNNFTITRNGNTTQGTFTPFSQTGWSNYFNGTTDYLSLAASTDWQWPSTAWTVEMWVYNITNTNYTGRTAPIQIQNGSATGDINDWSFGTDGNGNASFYYWNGNVQATIGSTVIPLNTWTHIAATYDGTSTIKVYVNGVLDATGSKTGTPVTSTKNLIIGAGNNAYYNGYISNLRRVVGSIVYTGNFTPSTAPLTAITNTQILTCQSNRFIDNSVNAYPFTIGGTPSVQAFSPFAPTAAYDPAVVGGSGYFDGTGDYLTIGSGTDFSLGTSDFAMEYWYYLTEYSTYAPGIFCKRTGGAATGWTMLTSGFVCLVGSTWYDSWSTPYWVGSFASTGFNNSTSTTKKGQWVHVLATRQGTNARWFVNGQLIGYQSRSGAIDQQTGVSLAIGFGGATTEQPYTGYVSNGRIVIGSIPTGYQTSSTTLNEQIFTPPTAPVTTTSQGATSGDVKYLGNFTNAGIIDSASKSSWETVNNAQVSTAQAKWGTTSIYFPGSTSNQRLLPSQNYQFDIFGTGDFTIECWLYVIAQGATTVSGLWDQRPGVNGTYINWVVDFGGYSQGSSSNPKLVLYTNSAVLYASGVLTMGAWNHVALCRASGTTRMFINGTLSGTAVSDPNNYLGGGSAGNYRPSIGSTDGGDSLYGYIDDFRVTRYARYVANFTPPTAEFPLQ